MTKIPSSPPSNDMSPKSKSLLENKVLKTRGNNTNHLQEVVDRLSSPPPQQPEVVASAEEMQELLGKLKELVPNMPRHKKLSKLEIIQNVIDYIFDLQMALESHPSVAAQAMSNGFLVTTSSVNSSCVPSSQSSTSSSSCGPQSQRQPLSTLSTGVTIDFK